MKKVLALVLALMFVMASGSAFAEKMTMATNCAFPPYEFYDGEEKVGIDVDVADAIAKKLGFEGVDVKDMDFGAALMAVQTGNAMVSLGAITATAERMKSMYFTFPYATGRQVIIVKEGSEITCVDDLFVEGKNYKIGTQEDTTGYMYTTWDLQDEGLATVFAYPTGNDAVMALVNGKVDCVVIDDAPAKAYVAANEGLVILSTEYIEEDYAIAVAKGDPEWLGKVNGALQDLIADGTVAAIVAKYINAD